MGHSRTPAQNTAGDGSPADSIDGSVCLNIMGSAQADRVADAVVSARSGTGRLLPGSRLRRSCRRGDARQ
jgi:hypothetical protein